jgi:hypothetical protein
VSKALDGLWPICVLLMCSIDIIYNICCHRLAQSVECNALNRVVVGSSTTVVIFQARGIELLASLSCRLFTNGAKRHLWDSNPRGETPSA